MSSLICVKSGTISIGEINRAIQTGDCYLREFAVNTIRPTQYSFWIVLRCVHVTVKSFPQQPYNSAQCRSVRLRAAHADFSQQFFGFSSAFKCLLHVPFLHPSNRTGDVPQCGEELKQSFLGDEFPSSAAGPFFWVPNPLLELSAAPKEMQLPQSLIPLAHA